jgi:hypothetical protein
VHLHRRTNEHRTKNDSQTKEKAPGSFVRDQRGQHGDPGANDRAVGLGDGGDYVTNFEARHKF